MVSCTTCGHEDWVTIGQTKYCAHCGEPATPTDSPAASATPVQPIAPTQTAPVASSLTLSDIKPTATPLSQPNPANSYHSRTMPSSASALDLRPEDAASAKPKVGRPAKVTRRMDMKVTKPAQAAAPVSQTPKHTATPIEPKDSRASRVTSIEKSPAIRRFTATRASKPTAPGDSLTQLVTPEPTVIMPGQASPASGAPASAASLSDISSPAVSKPTPEQSYNELPNQVLSQLKHMQGLIPPTADQSGKKPKPTKSKAAPRAVSIAAAGMAAAVMAGYVWLNNYDSLTIKAAAAKAGIAATAPGYLPASYNLAGSISFGNGFVSMQYKSPADSQQLTISQRRSDLTPSALLEVYVNKQAKTYLSVQSQGLTIYLLDDNQATWVNRGIQYVLQGNAQLGRDQLIKIAESL